MATTLRTENGIRFEHRANPEGVVFTGRDGTPTVYCVCESCRAWALEGQAIRHAKRCDTPAAQPTIRRDALTTPSARREAERAEKTAAQLKRAGREGVGLTADEAFEAQQRGQITTDEAMNRDN